MKVLIINGGTIDDDFALGFLGKMKECSEEIFVMAVDRGLEFCHRNRIRPNLILGDFDSLSSEILSEYENGDIPVKTFNPIKDDTDIEIALRFAKEVLAESFKNTSEAAERDLKSKGANSGENISLNEDAKIVILGGMGTRLDHMFGTIYALSGSMLDGEMVDPHNRIRILRPGRYALDKNAQYGGYVSLLPIGGEVTGMTLEGFYYTMKNGRLGCDNTLGISNRIVDQRGVIDFTDGIAALIETRD